MANFCPIQENICVSRGDSPVIPIEVRDNQGALLDVTGFVFAFTVSTTPAPEDDTEQLFQLTLPAIADGTSGIVQFQPSTNNTDLSPGVYFYDVQMTTLTPSVRTILAGQFEVQQDVTKL